MLLNDYIKRDIELIFLYDIETFNGFSKMYFNNAQLDTTYYGLTKTDIYNRFAKSFFDDIVKEIGEKAHNPVTDSLFTIIVAVAMNLIINEYFTKGQKGGYNINTNNANKYANAYYKYMLQYMDMKN